MYILEKVGAVHSDSESMFLKRFCFSVLTKERRRSPFGHGSTRLQSCEASHNKRVPFHILRHPPVFMLFPNYDRLCILLVGLHVFMDRFGCELRDGIFIFLLIVQLIVIITAAEAELL